MRFALCLLAALPLAVLLQAAPARGQSAPLPTAPSLPVRAYVLYDYSSNQILVNQNGHKLLAPAGLAKMMTAYVVLNASRQGQFPLSLKLYPSLDDLRTRTDDESSMLLGHNRAVTVKELLHGLMIGSADDAARTLVDLVSVNEAAFAKLMTRQARELGMMDTHFTNANGRAEPGNYTSAYDMTLLAAALQRDFPDYYALYARHDYTYNGIALFNGNRLLWEGPHIDGIKAGHNREAGYSLAASARRGQHRLIAVVMGAASADARDRAAQELLNFGYRDFETLPLYSKNQPVTRLRIWKGASRMVDIGFPDGLTLTVPRGGKPHFEATAETQQPVIAPVRAGQKLGVLHLRLDGKPYADYPLVALADVPLANVFARGWDAIRLFFSGKGTP